MLASAGAEESRCRAVSSGNSATLPLLCGRPRLAHLASAPCSISAVTGSFEMMCARLGAQAAC